MPRSLNTTEHGLAARKCNFNHSHYIPRLYKPFLYEALQFRPCLLCVVINRERVIIKRESVCVSHKEIENFEGYAILVGESKQQGLYKHVPETL